MNYDEARQHGSTGGWDWTTMNDNVIRTAWPCSEHLENGFHSTRAQAELHFYEACLEVVTKTIIDLTECVYPACHSGTRIMFGNSRFALTFRNRPLCADHRSRDVLAELQPFRVSVQLIHS